MKAKHKFGNGTKFLGVFMLQGSYCGLEKLLLAGGRRGIFKIVVPFRFGAKSVIRVLVFEISGQYAK